MWDNHYHLMWQTMLKARSIFYGHAWTMGGSRPTDFWLRGFERQGISTSTHREAIRGNVTFLLAMERSCHRVTVDALRGLFLPRHVLHLRRVYFSFIKFTHYLLAFQRSFSLCMTPHCFAFVQLFALKRPLPRRRTADTHWL